MQPDVVAPWHVGSLERMDQTSKNAHVVGLAVSALVAIGAPLVGLMLTIISVRRAVGASAASASPDPAQELAEGVSGSMAFMLGGAIVSVIALSVAIVLGIRLLRARS